MPNAPVQPAKADGARLFKALHLQQAGDDGHRHHHQGGEEGVERQPVVWDILEDVIRGTGAAEPRPTLHRLGIRAFQAGADRRQGDPAASARLLGLQRRLRRRPDGRPCRCRSRRRWKRALMLASNNVLFPSNSRPSIVPSRDIVLGLYYATRRRSTAGRRHGLLDLRGCSARWTTSVGNHRQDRSVRLVEWTQRTRTAVRA